VVGERATNDAQDKRMPIAKKTLGELPIAVFERVKEWETWLAKHHRSSRGVWIRMAKKATGLPSITHPDALDVALCYGWIDGTRQGESDTAFLQKFCPRAKRSTWSKINREKVQALIEAGRMQPAGLAEIERAKADGRWDAAYDSQRNMQLPPDLEAALAAKPRAQAEFAKLDSRNRFAILFRTQQAKKPETRAKRIAEFVAMLARGERIHPPAAKRAAKKS
jgi:uncharacterized protein YdeI (YjbR/CyaY-like superfamily)